MITQEDFIRYEQVREEGHYNMFDTRAIDKTGLSKVKYYAIVLDYDKYASQWK